jgi:DNA invertase Pin-like site-specific DNA recombinase
MRRRDFTTNLASAAAAWPFDMPSANAFMINVYAAVAQEERRMISDRTKAGLAAVKARGVKLGGPRDCPQSTKRARRTP